MSWIREVLPPQVPAANSRPRRHASLLLAGLAGLLAANCVTESELSGEYNAFIEERNSCEAVDECAMVFPGCPLGCATGVRKEYVDAAEAKARKLIRRYERGGRSCQYGCIDGEIGCEQGRCVVVDADVLP